MYELKFDDFGTEINLCCAKNNKCLCLKL